MILWLRHKRVPLAVIAAILVADWFIGGALVAWEIKILREYLNP